jgi:hypothetical protein
MFLSAITDRLTYFDADVSAVPINDPQNTAAAYNACITLRWMFANLDKAIGTQAPPPAFPLLFEVTRCAFPASNNP